MEMECMCLECGISHYLDTGFLKLEPLEDSQYKAVANQECDQCGGTLIVIGKAGDQPNYIVE